MTKYAAAGLTVLVVAIAIAVVLRADRGLAPASTAAGVAGAPTQVASAVPGVELPTAAPGPGPGWIVRSRQEAIEIARNSAAGFSEENPVLIDAALVPYFAAEERLRAPGDPLDDGATPEFLGLGRQERVWFVRMRGAFRPPRHSSPANPRIPGWMFVVVDPEFGHPVRHGYFPAKIPVR